MKTGKHQAAAPRRRARAKGPQTLLLLAAALVLVLLIVFLPRLGGKNSSAPAGEPVTRDIILDEPSEEYLKPLDQYDVDFQLEDGALTVSGSGAMPALERLFPEEELASVKTLSLGEEITALDPGAFAGCRLERLTIPAAMTQIAEGAFRDCPSLREILVEEGNPAYVSVDGVLYSADRSLLLCYPGARVSAGYRVPEGVTRIAAYAFSGFQLTDTLYLPASLTEIGREAFTRCYGLAAIKVSGSNPAFTAADGVLYDKDKRVLLRYPSGKTSQRFTVPRSVEEIADGAFCENYELTEATLPKALTRIGNEAFRGCSFLRAVSFPDGLLSIGDRAFLSCSRLQKLVLPDGLERLGDQAFAYCYELGALTLPARLQTIGEEVFRRCDSLTSVELPDGFSAIGTGMFRECASLESVRIPDSVSFIGIDAFADCHALKSVRFAGTQAQWDAMAGLGMLPDGAVLEIG